jgi:Tfp pilus assembly protein PilV
MMQRLICPAGQRRASGGFTLLEGLVALVVMAFGMLALISLQSTFSASSDEAKLRTEATRLAQQKLDELRSFEQVPLEAGKLSYKGTVVTGSDTITPAANSAGSFSNATFSRTWTVTPNTTDMHRTVAVTMAWTDRRGNQTLTLSSVIAQADPSAISTLGVGPGTTVVRRPKNRNINIPYPSVPLAGNRSAFQPPGSNDLIVFDNATGDVLGRCSNTSLPEANSDFSLQGCSTAPGYLLSGYVRFCTSNGCNAQVQSGDAQAQYANASDVTLALNATAPLVLDTSNQSGGTPTLECYSARQVTLTNGSTVADTGQANNQVSARFVSYACIAYPVDHDSNADTRTRWWGRVSLNPSGWTIGTSSSTYKVCRFTADYNASGSVSNGEHPLWYRGVTGALDNQNYLVVAGNQPCPTDKPTAPVSGDFVNANTATHQTSGTLATGAVLSFHCLAINNQGNCTSQAVIEPSTLSQDIPME